MQGGGGRGDEEKEVTLLAIIYLILKLLVL
jgi:hypothetical protein